MRTDLDLYRYSGFPQEVRQAFDDWALAEGINLAERRVRAVQIGEGVLECEQYVHPYDVVLTADGERAPRTEWHTYPVKTVPPLEMFTDDGFVGRLLQSARIDGQEAGDG